MKKSKNPGKKTTMALLEKTCVVLNKAWLDFNFIQKIPKPEYIDMIVKAGIKIVKPVKGE